MKQSKYTFRLMVLTLMVAFFMPAVAQQTRNESRINSEYHDIIMEYLRQEVQTRQKIVAKQAKQILVSLPNEDKLYDENYVTIKTNLVEGTREDGTSELNYVFDISYSCNHIEGITDDYPSGTYAWDSSNSCKAICLLTKTMIEGECADLFKAGKDVTVRIFSTTDGEDIAHINYGGEFGDFRYIPVTYNDEPVRISVNQEEGITTNAQLAFIRACSVRSYIENQIPKLQQTHNDFEFVTKSFSELGSQYRRSSIQITVHGAFDDIIDEMTGRLMQDDYIDYNIPIVEPNSNSNTFVLVIANEDYNTPFPSVAYAGNDGEIFRQYCIKTLGIPERHVKLLRNVGTNDIITNGMMWLLDISKAVGGNANIMVYYAGHAITDENRVPYIIPNGIDMRGIRTLGDNLEEGDPILTKRERKLLLEQCLSLDSLFSFFGRKTPNKGVTFIFDAAFDGTQRSGKAMAQIFKYDDDGETPERDRKIKDIKIRNDVVVFLAANTNQPAYVFEDQHHGFFTYFILRELKRTRGNITMEELFNNVDKLQAYESSLQNKIQIPHKWLGGKTKNTWAARRFGYPIE